MIATNNQSRIHTLLLLPMVVCFLHSGTLPTRAEAPARKYYGAKFEPKDGILHGAGQTYYRGGTQYDSFSRYADVLGKDSFPLLYMDYADYFANASFYGGLKAELELIESVHDRYLIPQIGLVLPKHTQKLTPEQVQVVVRGLKLLDRPAFFRPGYEANGPWNELEPTTFIENYRAIAREVRKNQLPVAMVWNVVVGDGGDHSEFPKAMKYYPGSEYVDWWACNVFAPVTFHDEAERKEVELFLAEADKMGKPVMLAEATPMYVGAEDAEDWEEWFQPFFDRIRDHPGVKAHTYINWDWSTTDPGDHWNDWKDARLETGNPELVKKYKQELSSGLYIHSSDKLPEFIRKDIDPLGPSGITTID